MRFGMVMAAVVLLLGGSSYRAEASPISYREWSNICSGDVVSACASVKLKTDGTLVTLQIENLSGLPGSDSYGNYLFTNISFFNRSQADIPDVGEGTATTMTGPTRTANSGNPPQWSVSNVNGSGGALGLDIAGGVNGNDGGIASSCATSLPGGSNDFWMTPACGTAGVTAPLLNDGFVLMMFATTAFWDLDATDTQFLIHAQSDLGAIKLVSGSVGEDERVLTPVPEPASLALLGLGLGGVAAHRRRRAAKAAKG